jgi:hypothetical protein
MGLGSKLRVFPFQTSIYIYIYEDMASQTDLVIIKFGLVDEVTDDLSIRKPPWARACLLAQDSKLLLIIIILKVKVSSLIQFH